jgi:hypothetical protein
VKLGYLEDVPSKGEAQQKLAVILKPINDLDQIPKMRITFREFIERYRSLKLANKKETTIHGYETNIRVHFLPAFGTMRLPIKAVHERLEHSRPDVLLNHYVHVLEDSAEMAAAALSSRLIGGCSSPNSP